MTIRSQLTQLLELQKSLSVRESELSLGGYLKHVVINSSPEPRPFISICQPWQSEVFGPLDRALESVVYGKPYSGPQSFWVTLPRGHDKTSAIGRRVNWVLGFSPRRLKVITSATDEDQGALILEAMDIESRLNPWIRERVRQYGRRVNGPGGSMTVINSDSKSAFGQTPDLIILDELTHWKKRDLWDSLISGRHKRPRCLVFVITNAGIRGSWQEQIFDRAKSDPSWYVYETPPGVHLATWMTQESVDGLRGFLDRSTAKRVLDNIWIDPGEESGFLNRLDVARCEQHGLALGLTFTTKGRSNVDYVAGVDYGPKRDRTALCVGHHGSDGTIRIDELTVLQGSPDDPVQVKTVENWIEDVNVRFHRPLLVIDPYQMEGTIQRQYEYHQNVVRHEARGGKTNYEVASTLRSLVVNGRLVWYPGAGDLLVSKDGHGRIETLSDELCSLVLQPTTYGYRFNHVQPGCPAPTTGTAVVRHDDRAVSIGMMALYACRNAPAPEWIPPEDISTQGPVVPDLRPFSPSREVYGIRT